MKLSKSHADVKRVRGRGSVSQGTMSASVYLRLMEQELGMIQQLLSDARGAMDSGNDWRKFLRHSDRAQQELHGAIKRLEKLGRRK